MNCDGLCLWWIVMDCDRDRFAEHTLIQTPLHIDAPHPNHTMRALVLHNSDAKTERLGTLFSSRQV